MDVKEYFEKQLDTIQRERQKLIRSVPDNGQYIEYLGKKFIVYKNVFWPFEDSMPLVENYIINPSDHVLDVCTGSGVIAIFSAYNGAEKVLAIDINPDSIFTANENTKLHGFDDIIEIRQSDMFSAIQYNEKFDVITGNLPFRNQLAKDLVEASQWDSNLNAHQSFFKEVRKHLKPNGRIYLSQANFGAVDEMKQFAKDAGFNVKLIGQKSMPKSDLRVFYAFELVTEK